MSGRKCFCSFSGLDCTSVLEDEGCRLLHSFYSLFLWVGAPDRDPPTENKTDADEEREYGCIYVCTRWLEEMYSVLVHIRHP